MSTEIHTETRIETERFITQKMWVILDKLIPFLMESRGREDNTQEINMGLNYDIILNSACYIEGVLGDCLKQLLIKQRNKFDRLLLSSGNKDSSLNEYYKGIEKYIDNKIFWASGISGYNKYFKLLTGKNFSEYPNIEPFINDVDKLFMLRNMLAHSREVSARLTTVEYITDDTSTEESQEESFDGNYKVVEKYLLNKNLLEKKITDGEGDSECYFTNAIADHFWNASKKFLMEVLRI